MPAGNNRKSNLSPSSKMLGLFDGTDSLSHRKKLDKTLGQFPAGLFDSRNTSRTLMMEYELMAMGNRDAAHTLTKIGVISLQRRF